MPYFLKRLNSLCRYTKQNGKSLVNSSVNPWNVQAAFLSLNIIQCLLDEPVSVVDDNDHTAAKCRAPSLAPCEEATTKGWLKVLGGPGPSCVVWQKLGADRYYTMLYRVQ
uniref:Uncharacterized protein n=1 Tax=Trichuris muris TaxID=70415 RepID=A0A5S6QD98_TRIMR